MLVRALIIATTAIVGGSAIGRTLVNRAVRGRVSEAVAIARKAAIDELSREVSVVVRQRVLAIAASLLWKAMIVGACYLLFRSSDLTAQGFQIAVVIMTIAFAVRDLYVVAPYIWTGYVFVRRHEWRPATALREFIAGVVFERAYERALAATAEPGAKHMIALSSFTREGLSEEIAGAVRDVAKGASLKIVRIRAALGLGAVLVVALTYSAFVAFALLHT